MNCKVHGCNTEIFNKIRELCKKHYRAWYTYGDPTFRKDRMKAEGMTCSTKGCSRKVLCRMLCNLHYKRIYRQSQNQRIYRQSEIKREQCLQR